MSDGETSDRAVTKEKEAVFDAYRAYRSEYIRLRRLPYAERDLAVLSSMETDDRSQLSVDFLFEEPETVEQSDRDPELALTLISLIGDEAVLSACRTQWRDLRLSVPFRGLIRAHPR